MDNIYEAARGIELVNKFLGMYENLVLNGWYIKLLEDSWRLERYDDRTDTDDGAVLLPGMVSRVNTRSPSLESISSMEFSFSPSPSAFSQISSTESAASTTLPDNFFAPILSDEEDTQPPIFFSSPPASPAENFSPDGSVSPSLWYRSPSPSPSRSGSPAVITLQQLSNEPEKHHPQDPPEECEHGTCAACQNEDMIPNVTYLCKGTHMICQKCIIGAIEAGNAFKCPMCNIPAKYVVGRIIAKVKKFNLVDMLAIQDQNEKCEIQKFD